MRRSRSIRYYPRFPEAIPVRGAGCPRVTQPFATLSTPEGALTVRLACVKRAASVHPEPGSNSPFKWHGACAPLLSECGSVRAGDPLILRTHEIHSRNIRDVPYLCGPGPLRGRSNSLVCLRRSHRSLYPVVKVRRADAPRKEIIYTIGGGPGAGMRRFTIPTQRPSRAGESQGARCVHAGIIPPGAPRPDPGQAGSLGTKRS